MGETATAAVVTSLEEPAVSAFVAGQVFVELPFGSARPAAAAVASEPGDPQHCLFDAGCFPLTLTRRDSLLVLLAASLSPLRHRSCCREVCCEARLEWSQEIGD